VPTAAVPQPVRARSLAMAKSNKPLGLAVVGTLTTGGRVEVIDAEGKPMLLTRGGYDHFA